MVDDVLPLLQRVGRLARPEHLDVTDVSGLAIMAFVPNLLRIVAIRRVERRQELDEQLAAVVAFDPNAVSGSVIAVRGEEDFVTGVGLDLLRKFSKQCGILNDHTISLQWVYADVVRGLGLAGRVAFQIHDDSLEGFEIVDALKGRESE